MCTIIRVAFCAEWYTVRDFNSDIFLPNIVMQLDKAIHYKFVRDISVAEKFFLSCKLSHMLNAITPSLMSLLRIVIMRLHLQLLSGYTRDTSALSHDHCTCG
ncbi:hypothetical protein NTE_00384 [Candidatus Nitrososphaera evergladensis SR1]|uniref:Uncharacterized protein n=1 Tax=Candidatus Nitrososphaera evergladensis SR1 TaxID=1459636 RepID=A0A075MLU1_9ARCH|nr:hypothetical protein NTE_00384 [Candidatus Nitrososphaera evergladensis SR1]